MTRRPVQVVVVAYHAADALDRTLEGLAGELPVTVVDNSQSDEVRTVSGQQGATYVGSPRNRGFAAGVNTALRPLLAGSPCDVLLLNPDAVVALDDVAQLVAAIDADARLAAVAPRLVGPDGSPQRVLWPFPSPRQAWLEAIGLARLQRGPAFAVGAVLLLRWEALQEVGLLDERFFLYGEEADWQRRAAALGWRTALCASFAAAHEGGGTSADAVRREALFHAAQETYVRKWYGERGWRAYRAAVVVGAVARVAALQGARRQGAQQRLRLYLRGPARAVSAGST